VLQIVFELKKYNKNNVRDISEISFGTVDSQVLMALLITSARAVNEHDDTQEILIPEILEVRVCIFIT
jgi:hypothetical protein